MRFYQHNIGKWMEGTETLTDGEYRVYHVIIELIYLNEGPIDLREKGIAGRCNQHILTFRRNLIALIRLNKLWVDGDKLFNLRALTEIKKLVPNCPDWQPPKPTPDLFDLDAKTGKSPPQPPPVLPVSTKGGLSRKLLKALNAASPYRQRDIQTDSSPEFEEFWNIRPKRDGSDPRDPACKKFQAAVTAGTDPKIIIDGMKRFAAYVRARGKEHTEFVPMAKSWLHQKCWKEEFSLTGPKIVEHSPQNYSLDEWRGVLRIYSLTNGWNDARHGPEPGRPGCLVPPELLATKTG